MTDIASFDDVTTREKVIALESLMKEQPQLELKVEHYFSPGVYARELHIPAGTILTGKIHKNVQLNILIKGDMSVLTENGVKRVQAPFTVVSPAGTKRIAYAHEDCVWTTILGTDQTDPEEIEKLFTVNTEEEYLDFCKTIDLIGTQL